MTKRKPISWKTERRKVSDLIPYEKNPRTLSDKQRADLTKWVHFLEMVSTCKNGDI